MQLHIDASGLLLAATRFRNFKPLVHRAIREGLNQGGDKVATDVRKALWKQTGVKQYKSILSRTRTIKAVDGGSGNWNMAGHVSAGGSDFAYQIIGFGKGIPIKEFKVGVRTGAGGGVVANPWGVSHQFKRSFKTKGGRLLARLPDKVSEWTDKSGKRHRRAALRGLYGPSIAKEIVQGAVPTVFLLSAASQVEPAIRARLVRALGAGV